MNKRMLMAAVASLAVVLTITGAGAVIELHNTITGEPLSLDDAPPEGKDSKFFKEFLETGKNPYNNEPNCLARGQKLFLGACSGCHGHTAEGKIGPGLNDAYWTYPDNNTDKGMFETVFGGASGQMGPMYNVANVDEILNIMAWVRHMSKVDVSDAAWLDDEQKKSYKPYDGKDAPAPDPNSAPEQCKIK
jgi:cytochrome c-L